MQGSLHHRQRNEQVHTGGASFGWVVGGDVFTQRVRLVGCERLLGALQVFLVLTVFFKNCSDSKRAPFTKQVQTFPVLCPMKEKEQQMWCHAVCPFLQAKRVAAH